MINKTGKSTEQTSMMYASRSTSGTVGIRSSAHQKNPKRNGSQFTCPWCGRAPFGESMIANWSPLAPRNCNSCTNKLLPALTPMLQSLAIMFGPAALFGIIAIGIALLAGGFEPKPTQLGLLFGKLTVPGIALLVVAMMPLSMKTLKKNASAVPFSVSAWISRLVLCLSSIALPTWVLVWCLAQASR